jgi:hypothetical protein
MGIAARISLDGIGEVETSQRMAERKEWFVCEVMEEWCGNGGIWRGGRR